MLKRDRYRSILRSLHWKAVLKYGRDALTALDVGAYDPFALTQLTWVPTKLALDIQFSPKQSPVWASTPGIVFLNSDIFKTKFVGRRFDLVMSSQVVGRIPPSMKKFVKRMMSLAKTLIVSTTYELPFGTIPGHVNDPISTKAFFHGLITQMNLVRLFTTNTAAMMTALQTSLGSETNSQIKGSFR